ncbi:MSCRAMM family protein [Ectobacillus funiculus]|uniref:MSCRAMM family protein n=1 Tax=Ectobacillus funiculus TaxID=137993 RepID=UPI00101CCBEC|nr:carboxypeptidase-like regulatory domain-containing protein [Ectobacillus funiculus]
MDKYVAAIFRIILEPGEERVLDVALQANPATIQGQVTDAQIGTPIAGARVVMVIQGSGIIVASTQTDQTGNYLLTGIAPRNYDVVFSAENFTSQTVSVNLTAGETEIVNAMLLPNAAVIQGQVNDTQTGAGIEGAIVTVTDSTGNIIARVETDSNGRFTVSNLHPGQYTLVASVLGYITGSEIVIVSGGEVVNVVIPLQKKKALKKGFILITKQTGCPICLTKSDCPTVFNLVGKSCSNCATLAYEIEIGNKIIQGSLIVDLRYFILVRV